MQNLCVDGEGVKWQREVIGGEVDPGSHSQILMTVGGEGGFDRCSYFIPKKSQLQNVSTQKCHYFF